MFFFYFLFFLLDLRVIKEEEKKKQKNGRVQSPRKFWFEEGKKEFILKYNK